MIGPYVAEFVSLSALLAQGVEDDDWREVTEKIANIAADPTHAFRLILAAATVVGGFCAASPELLAEVLDEVETA